MEARHLPITFLSEKEGKIINTIFDKLCSADKFAILEEQLIELTAKLPNVHVLSDLPFFNRRLNTIARYVKFTQTMQNFAASEAIILTNKNMHKIDALKKQLVDLESSVNRVKNKLEIAEDLHSHVVSSPRLEEKAIGQPKLFHSRTYSNLGQLINELSELDKGQMRLQHRIAEVTNDILLNNFIFPIIDQQLKQFNANEIRAYSGVKHEITGFKTEAEIDARYSELKTWLELNNPILSKIETSIHLVSMLDSTAAELENTDNLKQNTAILDNRERMRKYIPSSLFAELLLSQINDIFVFKLTMEERFNERKTEILATNVMKETSAINQQKHIESAPSHLRKRSSSQGTMFAVNASDNASDNRKKQIGIIYPRQISSSQLTTRWRKNSPPHNKDNHESSCKF